MAQPTFGPYPIPGGGGSSLPANSAGALTNNGSGTLGWLALSSFGSVVPSGLVTNNSTAAVVAGTGQFTNSITPTNIFSGTTVDFSKSDNGIITLSGALTFTASSGITLAAGNQTVVHMFPGGSDRVIAVPASWHIARGNNMVVSNAFHHSDFLFTCQPSFWTNVAEIDYP